MNPSRMQKLHKEYWEKVISGKDETMQNRKEIVMIKKELDGIKVLGNGNLDKKLTIRAHRFTQSALDKIEKSGSKAEVI